METAEDKIIAALKANAEGMGVREFAEKINVTPSLWVRTRDGKCRLGPTMAHAARHLPGLEREVVNFLAYELPTRNRKRRASKAA